MGTDDRRLNIRIYNGREQAIDIERMAEFETRSIFGRLFHGRDMDTTSLFEQLGPWVLDFTNVHGWSEEIPDIDHRSARLFTIWAEDKDTGEVLGIIRGFFVLAPFAITPRTMREYYMLQEDVPYYPLAIISSFRSIIHREKELDAFLDEMRESISTNWKILREKTIKHLLKGSDLWKRYVLSFDRIIHFTFLCPSIDREIIDALQRNNYRISGVLQLLASPSPSYDEATIKHHLISVQKLLDETQEEESSES